MTTTQKSSTDTRAFAGVKVLDLTRVLAGPFCAYQLALLGAEVIKIEPPGKGESVRWRAEADPSFGQQGLSLGFMTQSSNKRFLSLDLDTPEGRDIFLKLAAECDVVVQNLRSGSAEKRGIGYEAVKKVNPEVVFMSITAYGNSGPKKSHPAYDSVIQAWSGFMSVTGTKESGPLKAGPPIIDYSTGLAAAYAVSAALYQKQRTGKGQYIDLSMLDTNIILMASVVTAYMNTGAAPKQGGNDAASRSPASTTFNTADGLIAFAINEEHQHQGLLKVLGLTALNNDPRFSTGPARRDNIPALRALMQEKLMTKSAAEWEPLFNEAGAPAGRVRTIPECMAEAQTASRGLFHSFPPQATGFTKDLKVPLSPFTFAHDGPRADTPPRQVGADSEAILGELGYAAAEIAALRSRKVI
ncbi:MAG: CaiB/BaiF CoA-transferase family protein [Burkholderiales bacterium]|nr:CaiB/BaiF CoA-transferase family protein [Burkholderiales bacterium]